MNGPSKDRMYRDPRRPPVHREYLPLRSSHESSTFPPPFPEPRRLPFRSLRGLASVPVFSIGNAFRSRKAGLAGRVRWEGPAPHVCHERFSRETKATSDSHERHVQRQDPWRRMDGPRWIGRGRHGKTDETVGSKWRRIRWSSKPKWSWNIEGKTKMERSRVGDARTKREKQP